MKLKHMLAIAVLPLCTQFAWAGDRGADRVAGGVIGGALGSIIGANMGGRDGAIAGAGFGALVGVVLADQGGHGDHYRGRGYYGPPPRYRDRDDFRHADFRRDRDYRDRDYRDRDYRVSYHGHDYDRGHGRHFDRD